MIQIPWLMLMAGCKSCCRQTYVEKVVAVGHTECGAGDQETRIWPAARLGTGIGGSPGSAEPQPASALAEDRGQRSCGTNEGPGPAQLYTATAPMEERRHGRRCTHTDPFAWACQWRNSAGDRHFRSPQPGSWTGGIMDKGGGLAKLGFRGPGRWTGLRGSARVEGRI